MIALHVDSDVRRGSIEIESGYVLAAVDTFEADIVGEGCHGAYPHLGEDPVFILAQAINAIHGIRARRINPMRPAVISIGSVHGGDAPNVIPDAIRITGTIRSYDQETRNQLWEELEKALGIARALGGAYRLTITKGTPSLYNDPDVADTIRQTVEDMLGGEALRPAEASMGAEDFGCMTEEVPGAMFVLGAQIGGEHRPHHSPIFDLDESAFPVGAAVLAETACRLLRQTETTDSVRERPAQRQES